MANQFFLAEPSDLSIRVGVPSDDRRLLLALRNASDKFRGAVDWQVHELNNAVLIVNGSGSIDLRLPARDITGVNEVKVEGEVVQVDWDSHGLLNRVDGRMWPKRRRAIEVSLTYGFDPIPGDIQAVVLDQAEVLFNSERGISSKQVGGITLTYGQQETSGVTEQWATAVHKYHLRAR